jgi:hypothetical protein
VRGRREAQGGGRSTAGDCPGLSISDDPVISRAVDSDADCARRPARPDRRISQSRLVCCPLRGSAEPAQRQGN